MTPTISRPDTDEVSKLLKERMDKMLLEVLTGSHIAPRETALAFRHGRFVSIEIDADGNVIEPPAPCPHCGPVLLCFKHMAMVT